MLRMDQVHVIRHKVLIEGRKVRAVARELGVSRNTVMKYLGVSEPEHQDPFLMAGGAEITSLTGKGEKDLMITVFTLDAGKAVS